MTLYLLLASAVIIFCVLLNTVSHKIGIPMLLAFIGASIVFAIMATIGGSVLSYDLFHIVFCIVLLSIAFQGSFLPLCAKLLEMSEQTIDVMRTFNDYSDEADLGFLSLHIKDAHPWINTPIKQLMLPPDSLIVLILQSNKTVVPNGTTILEKGDRLVMNSIAAL